VSVEVTIVCDGCATLLAAGKTAAAARRAVPDHLPARLARQGGKDYCNDECERNAHG
jgi:hypothetical protein